MTIDEALRMADDLTMNELPYEAVDTLAAEVRRLRDEDRVKAEALVYETNCRIRLDAERDELKRVIQSCLKIKDLWLPACEPPCHHDDEFEALCAMHNKLVEAAKESDND